MEILGCRLDLIDADEAAERILSLARQANGAQVVVNDLAELLARDFRQPFRPAA